MQVENQGNYININIFTYCNINEGIDKVRRQTYQEETNEEQRKVIKGSRWLLLYKDKSKFTEDMNQRLNTILEINKPLATAYYLKEEADEIWKQPSKAMAEACLERWCATAEKSELAPMVAVAKSLRLYKTGILAWYDYKTSNAKVEGINNKIKVMKRNAYGFRDSNYFNLHQLKCRMNPSTFTFFFQGNRIKIIA